VEALTRAGFTDLRTIHPKARLGYRPVHGRMPLDLLIRGESRARLVRRLRAMDKRFRYPAFRDHGLRAQGRAALSASIVIVAPCALGKGAVEGWMSRIRSIASSRASGGSTSIPSPASCHPARRSPSRVARRRSTGSTWRAPRIAPSSRS
jgi:hypothetical protein